MRLSTLCFLYCQKKISRRMFICLRLSCYKKAKNALWDEDDEWEQEKFNIDNFSDLECWRLFRFKRDDLVRFKTALQIPDFVKTQHRDRVSGLEALCIVLRRFAYPNRWIELRRIFVRSQGFLSRIFYVTLRLIDRFAGVLSLWEQPWLTKEDFAIYAGATAAKGGVIPYVFGFIDGTARPICRPKYFQRAMYSGHKRQHCTKWQAVLIPNGIICGQYGGERGTMHGSRLFKESGLLPALKQKQQNFIRQYALYADAGYGKNELLQTIFKFRSQAESSEAAYQQSQVVCPASCRMGFQGSRVILFICRFQKANENMRKASVTCFTAQPVSLVLSYRTACE